MKIYQQFRLIWRRQSNEAIRELPPIPRLLLSDKHADLAMVGMHEARGSAAAAA